MNTVISPHTKKLYPVNSIGTTRTPLTLNGCMAGIGGSQASLSQLVSWSGYYSFEV